MRRFRRLPPFLRAVYAVAMLCYLVETSLLAAFYYSNRSASPDALPRNFRLFWVAMNLTPLGLACVFYGLAYIMVFTSRPRQPARRRRFPLDSWQSQALTFAVMAGPALCGLLLALVTALSPTVAVDPNVVLVVILVAVFWPVIVMVLLPQV